MDIHTPKPWHGVREFLKEYAIIVVGVLTALGAEQTVEWLHRGTELRETREAIREEIADNAAYADMTAREETCMLGVADRLLEWADGKTRPDAPRSVSPFFTTTVWDGSQTIVGRMPLKEKFTYGHFYEALHNEQTLAVTLRAQATHIGRFYAQDRLNAEEARALRQDVAETLNIIQVLRGNALWIQDEARKLGAPAKPLKAVIRRQIAHECQIGKVALPDFDTPERPQYAYDDMADGAAAAAGRK
jgi:hypothetical protein